LSAGDLHDNNVLDITLTSNVATKACPKKHRMLEVLKPVPTTVSQKFESRYPDVGCTLETVTGRK
jgi:hypothetical protein